MAKIPQSAIELAVSQAKKSPMLHQHGAVIWKNNVIMGAGYNYYKTPPSKGRRRFSIHGERDALNGLRQDQIYGASMLAIRIRNDGSISSGAPCKGCSKLLKRKGIAKVYWYDDESNLNCTYLN
jgi:deoxycytidylate deaminase